MIPGEFNFETISRLPEAERDRKLTALEALLNLELAGAGSLAEYQRQLYSLTDELNELGFFLGRWDYDSEVEIWGGPSYMDASQEDDLLLRSEYPKGVKLAWKDYDQLTGWSDP